MLTSLCVSTYEKTHHLTQVFQAIARHAREPYEIVVVDDCSKNPDVVTTLKQFQELFTKQGIRFVLAVNEKNMKHAATQNKAWDLAQGDVLFHIEDDILMIQDGWNLAFAKALMDHPEVGQVIPEGSGRGEWIPRGPYREFQWGLGGLFAVRRETYEKIGGWDESLVHQVEPDYNLRVRMAGWRLAEVPGVHMVHLGEGEQHDTFKRQAQIITGVHSMLMKWNKRFMGFWDYDSVWSMSWDDFPPNVAFRRQLAAWFVGQAQTIAKEVKDRYGINLQPDTSIMDGWSPECKAAIEKYRDYMRCQLNARPMPFKFPGHWGGFELIQTIRPPGREREAELTEKMLSDLAARYGLTLTDEEMASMLSVVPTDYRWERTAIYGHQ